MKKKKIPSWHEAVMKKKKIPSWHEKDLIRKIKKINLKRSWKNRIRQKRDYEI